jgi:hypothetical protein
MATQQQQRSAATTHWRSVHRRLNPNLLYAEDLLAHGLRQLDVVIVDSGIEQVAQMDGKRISKKAMPWIAFEGKKKRFALNATCCKAMATLSGTGIVEQWRGPITLIVVEVEYKDQSTGNKERTDALRIAPKRPRPYEPDRERLARQAAAREENARQDERLGINEEGFAERAAAAGFGSDPEEYANLLREAAADAETDGTPLTDDEKRQIAEQEAKSNG